MPRLILSPLSHLVLLAITASCTAAAGPLEFNRDIRPILSSACFACHGLDAKARQADLRLDVAAGAYAEREGQAAVKPGDLDASQVWQRITSADPEVRMPPADAHRQLTEKEIDTLKRWIEQGAPFQRHWAFEPPQPVEPPPVQRTDWPRTPIDEFLLARLEAEGLAPSPEADKPTLLRRVAFALTGLPPTFEEARQYLEDTSAAAYENMVERYLASPRHGEEMARHWLDLARYADTHGLHLDNEREMWAYRDWVVNAFNSNQPFDQFTIEQLAGDLLEQPTQSQLIATGFNRCNVTTSEGGSIADELLNRYAVERAGTTIETWLGLTGGCAVCHDHKFDPLSMKEFYSLYAFFYSAADPGMDGNVRNTQPFLSLATPAQQAALAALLQQEQAAAKLRDEFIQALDYADPANLDGTPATADTAPQPVNDLLFDDLLPLHASIRTKTRDAVTWTPATELACPSGLRSWKQSAADSYYDRIERPGQPWVMPQDGEISVWVRTDPAAPPKAILLEFGLTKGTRRAIWGDANLVGAGEIGKPERFRVGELPPPGEWTQLTVSAAQLAWKPGVEADKLSLIEVDGVVWWDAPAISGMLPAHKDPRASFHAWWALRKGQETSGVAKELHPILKAGPKADVDAARLAALRRYWLTAIARPTSLEWNLLHTAALAAEAARRTLEDDIPGTFTFADLPTPRQAHLMLRGQYDKPGEAVEPATPAVLPPLHVAGRPTRLDLARWLVADEQPLTARVAVNRYWQQFFGTGLVETSSDFGSQGTPPSHPELLDWLAVWYRDQGWNTRDLVRLIVNSAAFRQQSVVTPELLERDPKNRLLARAPRPRLDAEQIRDNALFASGLINLQMGGPAVRLYQPGNIWEPVGYADSNTRFYLQDHGDKLYRRSLYAFLKRTAPPPFMSNFDGPNREQACTRRERSNTPLQALQLMNDIQHVEAARTLAARIIREGGDSVDARLAWAWRLLLTRDPEPAELSTLRQTLADHERRFQSDPAAAKALIHVGESQPPADIPAERLAAYLLIANLLLNLDETVTRN